jgi:predicted signal transduction protein with EAL and GGDEF domain
MKYLWLYDRLSRLPRVNYRGKIMLTAFVGTHVPLIALIAFFAWRTSDNWREALVTVGVALAATLVGTAATLFVLDHLLRPILVTARGLRSYATTRVLPALPTHYSDEAGRLMADTARSLARLDTLLDRLAHVDAATGLANGAGFLRALADLLGGRDAALALGALRIRSYERLVSTFGQATADAAMRELADRLTAALGAERALGRIDSAVFAFPAQAGSPDAVAAELESLSALLAGEIVLGELRVVPEIASAAAFYPYDGTDAMSLVNAAMLALGESGEAGEIAFFSLASRDAARERFVMEQDLRRAIARDELHLNFQPVVECDGVRLAGAEALVRWQHRELGLIPPGRFVPVAEAAGLAGELDFWVLRQACAEARAWQDAGLEGLRVAVNLSARHFRDSGLVRLVEETLQASRLAPSALEVEVTETAAMEDLQRSRAVFGSLREMGVSIAIDDFGTGYSSLSYLKNLPCDRLKIDREFVRDVDSRRDSAAICQAIIALGRGLELEVLAEGAETEAEVRELIRQGCSTFQGYFFARPMAAEDFRARAADPRWLATLRTAAAA